MSRRTALAFIPLLLGLGVATPRFFAKAPQTRRVQVHCPNGNNAAFVTPVRLTVALGDSVEWVMAGPVSTESLVIAPKDSLQVWPFEGRPSRGQSQAKANRATRRGTYSYSVSLVCTQNGVRSPVLIDPDIIVE